MEKCDKCGEFIEFARLCPLCAHYEKERANFLESEVEEYSEKYLSLYRDFAAEKERSEQLESLVRELADNMQEAIDNCEVCRDEYTYTNTPKRSWLCARCQTFLMLVDKAKEALGDDQNASLD